VSDFKEAVLDTINPNEAELRSAVNTAFDAMYSRTAAGPLPAPGAPGEIGPPGAPFAPSALFGAFAFCGESSEIRGSIYNISWTASTGADSYGGHVKLTDDIFYSLTGVISAPQTSGIVVTNTTGDARISACNAAGCSGLSSDRFPFSQQPQCENF
jgi:hypothetical protein